MIQQSQPRWFDPTYLERLYQESLLKISEPEEEGNQEWFEESDWE